jgi:hypothetical protein
MVSEGLTRQTLAFVSSFLQTPHTAPLTPCSGHDSTQAIAYGYRRLGNSKEVRTPISMSLSSSNKLPRVSVDRATSETQPRRFRHRHWVYIHAMKHKR